MRFYPDRPDVQVPTRWFFCNEDARTLKTPTVFSSRNWSDKRADFIPLLGEVDGAEREWVNGAGPTEGNRGQECSQSDFFQVGQLYSQREDFEPVDWGLPPCCLTALPPPCPTWVDLGRTHPALMAALAAGIEGLYAANTVVCESVADQLVQDFGSRVITITGSPVMPRWMACWNADHAFLLVIGSTSDFQLLSQFLSSTGGPVENGGFGFSAFAAAVAANVQNAAYAAGLPLDVPLLFSGHSLGGSVATWLLAREMILRPGRVTEATTFGEPRCGDLRLRVLVDGRHSRIEREGDLVPKLPPDLGLFVVIQAIFPLPILLAWQRFQRSSQGMLVTTDGQLLASPSESVWTGELLELMTEFASSGVVGVVTAHLISAYVMDLMLLAEEWEVELPVCSISLESIEEELERMFIGVLTRSLAQQIVGGGAFAIVELDTPSHDTSGFWTSGAPEDLVIPQTGFYELSSSMLFTSGGVIEAAHWLWTVNGATLPDSLMQFLPFSTGLGRLPGKYQRYVVELQAGDVLQILLGGQTSQPCIWEAIQVAVIFLGT